jgi:hypothetical protein
VRAVDQEQSDIAAVGRHSANGLMGAWSPEELYRASALLEQLEHHPGWEVLCRLMAMEREGLVRAMTAGLKPLTRSEYAFKGGRANGLASMRAIVATVHEKAKRVRKTLADELGPDEDDTHDGEK